MRRRPALGLVAWLAGCSGQSEHAGLLVPASSASAQAIPAGVALQVVGASGPAIAHVALSGDGALLATCAGVNITVWEVDAGKPRPAFAAEVPPGRLAFSADGTELHTLEGRYRVVDGARVGPAPEHAARPPLREAPIEWASLPAAQLRALEAWAPQNGGRVRKSGARVVLEAKDGGLWASDDGLLVASDRGALRLDLGKSFRLPAHPGHVRRRAEPRFGPDPERMAFMVEELGGTENVVALWDTRASLEIASIGTLCAPRDIAWGGRGRWLSVPSCDGARLHLYDSKSGAHLGPIAGTELVAVSDDQRRAAVRVVGGNAAVYELPSLRRVLVPAGTGDEPRALLFSPDGEALVDVRAGDLHVWTLPSGALDASVALEAGPRPRVAFTRDGNRLVVGSRDTAWILDWTPLRVRERLATPGPFDVSRSGDLVVVARAGVLELHRQGAPTKRVSQAAPHARELADGLALTPDGSTAAVAFSQGAVELYDLVSGSQLAALEPPVPGGYATGLAFDPTGERLAYARDAGAGPEITLWNVKARTRTVRGGGAKGNLFTSLGLLLVLDDDRVVVDDAVTGRGLALALPRWAAPGPLLTQLAWLPSAPTQDQWFPDLELADDAHLGTLSVDGARVAWAQDRAVVVRKRRGPRAVSLFAFQAGAERVTLALAGSPRPGALFQGGACGWDGPAGAERWLRAAAFEPGTPAPSIQACRRTGLAAETLR